MNKNWLIRTKAMQILGPVSKDKLTEYINKGALEEDDEITSGNGYWFNIREKDLLNKFIYSDEIQGFNPISEAKTVLSKDIIHSEEYDEDDEDEFDDITLVKNITIDLNNSQLPDSQDLEYPESPKKVELVTDSPSNTQDVNDAKEGAGEQKKSEVTDNKILLEEKEETKIDQVQRDVKEKSSSQRPSASKKKTSKKKKKKTKVKSKKMKEAKKADQMLYTILVLSVIILALFYFLYRYGFFPAFFHSQHKFPFFSDAQAQESLALGKKKSSIH